MVLSLLSGTARAAELCPVIRPGNCPAETKILEALEDDTRLEFIETPLNQFTDFLRDQHDIPIAIDVKALDEVGVPMDTPITGNVKGVSLHAGLQFLLAPLDLTYCIEDEVLKITTQQAAESRPELRIYDVSALLSDGEDAASLVGTLQAATQPEPRMVAPAGGYGGGYPGMGLPGMPAGGSPAAGMPPGAGMLPGAAIGAAPRKPDATLPRIVPHKRLLIVRHTSVGHREFSKLLEALAFAVKSPATGVEHKKP
ncbi:MAG TPA: hypothetical protein PLF81_22590 [Candidatus Anammoximicrobium sp.]|nr:hypothetical protein [Candidatus Anammoximicrobium sp.]